MYPHPRLTGEGEAVRRVHEPLGRTRSMRHCCDCDRCRVFRFRCRLGSGSCVRVENFHDGLRLRLRPQLGLGLGLVGVRRVGSVDRERVDWDLLNVRVHGAVRWSGGWGWDVRLRQSPSQSESESGSDLHASHFQSARTETERECAF